MEEEEDEIEWWWWAVAVRLVGWWGLGGMGWDGMGAGRVTRLRGGRKRQQQQQAVG
jgi:hypothetical protein